MTTVITPSTTNTLTYDTVSLNGNLLTSFTYGSSNITFNADVTIYSYLVVSGGNPGTNSNTVQYYGQYSGNYGGNGGAGGTVIVNTPTTPYSVPKNTAFTINVGAGGTTSKGGSSSLISSLISTTAIASDLSGTAPTTGVNGTPPANGANGTLYSITNSYYGGAGGAGGTLTSGGTAQSGGIGGIGGGAGGGGGDSASLGLGGKGSSQTTSGGGGAGGALQVSGANVTANSNGGNGSSYSGAGKGGSGGGGGGAVRNYANPPNGPVTGNTANAGTGGNGGTSLGATSGGTGGYGSNSSYPGGGGGGGAGGVNTGGGGGGGGGSINIGGGNGNGGAGGSGIVIIYYKINNQLDATNKDANGLTYTLNSTTYTATITAGSTSASVNILSYVVSNNYIYNVTAIGDNAFLNNTTITAVIIPSSITAIGVSAFQGCTALNSVNMTNSVVTIGNYAFTGCSSLIYLSLPPSITNIVPNFLSGNGSRTVTLSGSNYVDASGISYTLRTSMFTATATVVSYSGGTSLAIPINVKYGTSTYQVISIANGVFNNKSLTSVIFSPLITGIGDNAFSNNSLTSITLPSGLLTIGTSCFENNNITSIIFPYSMTTIGSAAFKNNKFATLNISNNITNIGPNAFQNNALLRSLTLSNIITSIGTSAFQDCSSLIYVSLPPTITSSVSSFLVNNGSLPVTLVSGTNYIDASGITYNTLANGTATVIDYNGGTSLAIPINIKNGATTWTVTSIADNAFSNKSLTSVILPPFITSIGNYAFYNNSLTTMSLPPGLTSIGTHCFENNLITSAYFPSNLTNISESIFQNNRLVSINVSPSLTTIGNYSFAYNYINTINNSTTPSFPATLTSIGQYAFKSNQLSNITLPTNVSFNTLADGVFSYNLLQTIRVPNTITTIGIEVFRNNSITSFDISSTVIADSMFRENAFTTITIPSQVTSIGPFSFFSCQSVTAITFNSTNTLKYIDEGAFQYNQFQSINLPTTITAINQNAFSVGSLTSVIIPSSVTVMDNGAFYGNQLTSVSFANNISSITYLSSSVFENNRLTNFTIPSSVTSIQQFAFNNNLLTSVSIPSTVTSIGQYALANNQLTPLTAPSQTTITSIGYAAFYNNTSVATTLVAGTTVQDSNGIQYSLIGPENNGQYESHNQYIARVLNSGTLTSIVIPFAIIYNNIKYNITSIANSALSGKTLSSVTLNMNINSIGQFAFSNNNLTSITIPNSVTTIGDAAFYINRLTSVNISTNVSYLGGSLFQQNNLTNIIIPPNVTAIIDYVFADNLLTSISIPSSITSIPQYAFRNNRLTTIDLSNTLINQIANNAFQSNTLTQVSIPSRITSIGNSAFQYNRLTAITFMGTSTITTINNFVFADNSLNSITIPPTITTIGNNALQNNLLTNIQLPSNTVYIGQYAFQNNRLQSAITIPSTVNYVGDNAFATNRLSNTIDVSYNAVITFSGNNQTITTTLGGNIFNNNAGSDINKKVYITYTYGKKWASTTTTLTNAIVPLPASFDTSANTIQIIIQKATLTPIISVQNKIYDGTTNAIGTFSVIAISPDTLTLTGTARFADKNAGQNKTVNITNLTISGDASANYTLANTTTTSSATITQKTITPFITANTKTYDTTTTASFSYSLPGVDPSDTLVIITGTASFSDSSAGQNKPVSVTGLVLSGDGASNYALSSSTIATTGTITKKYVYFSVPNKIYDGSSTILTYDLSGVYASDASFVSASGLLYFSTSTVGQNILVDTSNISLSGLKSTNYDAYFLNSPPYNSLNTRLTGNIVQKALDLSSSFIKTYDATTNYNNRIDLSGVAQSDIGFVDFSYTVVANYDVSAVTANKITMTNIYLKGTKASNYSINQTIDVSGRILQKPLDVSATIVKVYDGSINTYNNRIDLSGVIQIDSGFVDISYSLPSYDTLNAGTNKTVTIQNVSLTGTKKQNYTINPTITVNGIINKKILDVSASAIAKVYDTTTNINFVVDLIGVLPGDNVSATVTAGVSSPNVGTYSSFTLSDFVLSGTQFSNYDITSSSVIQFKNSAIITRKFLTASANVIEKIYSGDISANVTYVLNGVLSNDNVSIANNYIAKYRSANVGQTKPVDVSNIRLIGDSSNNYDISSTLLLYGNILRKSIDLSCGIITKIYDGSRNATSVPLYLIGTLDNSTNVTFTSANFNTASTGTNKQVTITGISIYGDTSSNYNLSYNTLIVNGTITPKLLTISASGISRPYDSTRNASVIVSLNGKISSDTVNVTYTSSLFNDSHVGVNKPITISGISLTGSSAVNYNINSDASINASITPYTLGASNLNGIVSTKLWNSDNPNDISANVQLYLNNIIPSDQNNLFVNYASAYFMQNGPTVYNNSNKLNVRVTELYLSGSAANDYSLNITSLDLSGSYINIIQTPLRIVLNDSSINKIYDGTARIDVSLSLYNDASNIVPPNVTINYISSNFDNKNIGTNKNITITGITLNGEDSIYYKTDSSLSTVSMTALKGSISKKRIDISRNMITKYYDGNAYSNNILLDLSGIITGDSISCVGDASFNSSTPGETIVNVRNIHLIGDSSMNYDLSSTSIVLSGQIDRKILIVSASKIYDGSNTLYQTDLSLSGIVQNEIIGINAIGEYSQIAPGSITANLRNVSLTGTDSENYNLNFDASNSISNINATIYPKQLGLSISKVYNGLTNIISTDVSLNGIINNENVYFGGTGNFADASAGTNIPATISNSLLGNDRYNYEINVSNVLGTILRKQVNVVVSAITYDGSNIANINNFSITTSLAPNDIDRVNLTKSLAISNFYYDSSQSGNRVILNASGNLFITGDLSKNYVLDNTQTINAIINRRQINITAKNKVYDGSSNYNISNFILNNVISGDDVSLNATRIYTDVSNVGTGNVYIIEPSLVGTSYNNYSIASILNNLIKISIIITKRPIILALKPRIYDGLATVYIQDLSLNNIVPGDIVNVNGNGTYDSINAGNRIATFRVTGSIYGYSYRNYDISNNQSINAVITRKPAGLTILPRYYEGSSTVYLSDFSLNNILPVDRPNLTITGAGTYNSKTVGNKIASLRDLSFSGPASINYDISATIQVDASINRLPVVLGAFSKIYDTTTSLNIKNIYVKNKIINDNADLSGNGYYDSSFVGNRTITLNNISLYGSDSSNYIVSTTAQIDGSINPHPVTIAVNDKIYDGTDIATDLSLNDVYQIDINKVFINGYLLYKNSIANTNKIVDVSNNLQNVYLTGDYSFNYYIFNNIYTTGNVYPRQVTIVPTVYNKTYDRVTDANLKLDISGLVMIDNGQYFANYDYANYDNILVGQPKQINVKNIYITGPYVENYTYNTYLTTTGSILPARLTINALPQSKNYDNTNSTTAIYSLNGVFENDNVIVTGDASFNDKNAGRNKSVTMTNFALTGDSSSNYYIDSSLVLYGTADISTIKLIPFITNISTKTYDGSRNTTGTIDLSGIISPNKVTANGTFLFRTPDVANNIEVYVSNIYLIGEDASNYELSFNDLSGTSNIKPLKLTILPYTKPYDGTVAVNVSTIQLTGMLNNESISLGGSAVFDSPFVGSRTISITETYLTGSSVGNYTINTKHTIHSTITKRRLTITVNDKIYDGSVNRVDISNVTLNGIQNNDTISISDIDATYANNGNVATQIRIDISNLVISGDLSSQYDISGTDVVYGNIIPKPLTISATAINKLYDGLPAADANVTITDGIIPGDTVYIISFNANFDTPDIGDNKTVNITNIQLGGPSSSNYAVSSTITNASILYNPYIKTCNPVSSSSTATCNLQNYSNLQSYQTNPNTSRRIKYAMYTTRNSYNS